MKLNHSADLVWQDLDDNNLPLTGAGITIADLDTGVDVHHPALFHRLATPLTWIDAHGGGFAGNGGEWVDLNGDGNREVNETLRYLEASTDSLYPPGNGPGYTPGMDWLYADSNGNQRRWR